MDFDRSNLDALREAVEACASPQRERMSALLDRVVRQLETASREAKEVRDAQADAIVHSALLMTQLEESDRERAEATQAKEDFFANVSHELRTPLHGILSYAAFGIRDISKGESEKLPYFFQRIVDLGDALHTLVNDLLDLSMIRSGSLPLRNAEARLSDLATDVAAELAGMAQRHEVRFAIETNPTDVVTIADPNRYKQLVRNLVSNAIRYSPSGGIVTIRLTCDEEWARTEVLDEGPGIPDGMFEAIFDRFTQAGCEERRGSAGLGLAICAEIVKAHGGRIRAENRPGSGALFTAELPNSKESQPLLG